MRSSEPLRLKALEELQKKNVDIRLDIDRVIMNSPSDRDKLWSLINNLVENELQQEELCD